MGEGMGQQLHVSRSQILDAGLPRDQLVTASPHPSENASPSDQGSLSSKAPGLVSQSVAFSQVKLEKLPCGWYV